FDAVRERVLKFTDDLESPGADVPHTELRVAVNDLLMRLSVAVLTYSIGSGLLRQRDAQRLVREAMFFIVWSAPEKVRAGTLARLLENQVPHQRVMDVE
ncbi:MAG: hypothetical protein O7F76_08725, partial [Planctomycetota bacterium]|nr:hypothetical protein [Planctomycetota bacterium]